MAIVTFNITVVLDNTDDEVLLEGINVQVERLQEGTFEFGTTNSVGFVSIAFDEVDIIGNEQYQITVLQGICTEELIVDPVTRVPDTSENYLLRPVSLPLDEFSVNEFNFYRWFKLSNPILPLTTPLNNLFCAYQGCLINEFVQPQIFPTQYKKGLARFGDKPTAIQVFTGFTVAFQVNFNPDSLQDSTDFVLGIMDSTNLILQDFADLEFITDEDGNVNIFATFPFPVLDLGIYYLAIFSGDYDELVYVCSPVEVLPIERFNESGEIRYRNQNPIYDYQYAGSPEIEAFETVARIPLSVLGVEYRDDEEVYKEVSTGVHLAYKSETDRVFNVEVYFVDDNVHEAAATAIKHDQFKINGIELQKASPYIQNKNRSYNKSTANIQFFDNKFARVNKGC